MAPYTVARDTAPPDLRMLRLADVERMTGLRRSSIYERVALGRFPRPLRLSDRAVGWLAHEVEAWVHERIAERDAAHPPARQAAPEQASA
jgi:prophage regulatory protein